MVERTATELNLLHFHVAKCQGVALVESIRPRIAHIGSILQSSLQQTFLESLEADGDLESLRRCLRIYAMVDKIRDVEELFKEEVVIPYMENCISEGAIRSDPQGLRGMYRNVLDFVPQKCKLLQEATRGSSNNEAIQGYDFVVNTGWPVVVEGIEARTPSIFNPGNPNAFHERYLISMEFLDKWERLCGSVASVKCLREHPAYSRFLSRWNLAVYYQIRYQEVAGNLEKAIGSGWLEAPRDSSFQLLASHTLWQCLHTCWSDNVFLIVLAHRFWKLSLQLLSRFIVWVQEVSERQSKLSSSKEGTGPVHVSASSPNLVRMNGGSDGPRVTSSPCLHDPSHISGVLLLLMDIQHLEHDLPSFIETKVKARLPEALQENMRFLTESLAEGIDKLHASVAPLNKLIVKEVSGQCQLYLRQVTDIPRLYRRTKREVPTKQSQYVGAILRPVNEFLEENEQHMTVDQRSAWLQDIITAVSNQYYVVTNEVLVSVQRMEESLKKLKRARDKVSSDSPRGMTDDNKIRQQLWLDVCAFTNQVENFGVDSKLQPIHSLMELVEVARTGNS